MNYNEAASILELPDSWSQEDVKKQFRKLAAKYHPDKNPGNEEALNKSKQISEAFNLLKEIKSSDDLRNVHQNHNVHYETYNMHMDDIFDLFMNINSRGTRHKIKRVSVDLSFSEMALGCTKEVSVDFDQPCQKCPKTGECQECKGKKVLPKKGTWTLNIPPGIAQNYNINITHEGVIFNINFNTLPDPLFQRNGNNIFSRQKISLLEALEGTQLEINTIYGKHKIKIPPKSKHGEQLTIPGKGINKSGGNHIVLLEVEYPSADKLNQVIEMLKKE